MSKKIFCLIIFFLNITLVHAADRDLLLGRLDSLVQNRQYYMDRKEKRIDSLRYLLYPEISDNQRYIVNKQIYNEYSTYRCDSAMLYVLENKRLAEKMNIQKYKDETAIQLSILLSTTGLYLESMDNLNEINRSDLNDSLLIDYYYVWEWTYYTASQYTNDSLYAPQYHSMERLYQDSMLSILPIGTDRYNYYKAKMLLYEGKSRESLDLLITVSQNLLVDTRLYAIVTYDIANIYNSFDNADMYEQYLILASISDQVCPLKENLAMQELALYLFRNKPKDLDRAYTYIQCSMEDARFYNNRLRMVQISEKLPIIITAYKQKIENEKSKLTMGLMLITLLSIVTIVSLIYVFKQIGVVKRSREKLRNLNKELKELNVKLNEANLTREEYVGLFINLCSSYIDKLDTYRKLVKRKLLAKQFDDLYKMVNSSHTIELELDDFFASFDAAFIKLYPSFIDDFNSLLLPNEKIEPKKGQILNRELRIFALIRLGINDSSRIASFLRYSPQTIYNNRTKVRNKAVNRDDFENNVLKIGTTYIENGHQ